jgi:hypothetical protein
MKIMDRFFKSIYLLIVTLLILFQGCSTTGDVREECAFNIVETSTYILYRDNKIPFSHFHAHDAMYHWVVHLQKENPDITPATTIINIDYHSDAYGSCLVGNEPDDYKKLLNLNIGNWIRFLHVNGVCTGDKVLVSNPDLIRQIKIDRRAFPVNDLFSPTSEYDDGWIFNDNLFSDPCMLKTSDISGPAIITIDYDFLASIEATVTKADITEKAYKIAEALFTAKIVPVAINFTYSDLSDKKSGSDPFIHTSFRDYVSKCLVEAFASHGAVFKK